jgi:hypothetical protein
MSKNKIATSIIGLGAAAMLLSALPAAAQTVTVSTSVSGTAVTQRLATIITRSNTEISARITDLNKLNTQVQAMTNESAAEKADISAQVQTNITGLTALQTKIDADTTVVTARADEATIFTTFRIYALIVPRGYILASADRITTIDGLMNTLGAKMQDRITADQSAGKNVSALVAAMTDMNAKITDSGIQSQTAQSGVINLNPDQGNQTIAASNKAALLAARANIKTGTQDLQAARQDIATILQGLKSLGANTSVSASATTNVQ